MKITGVALLIAVTTSVLFAVACGGGEDTDGPGVAVKEVAPTHPSEPTSAPVDVSPQPITPP